MNVCTGLNDKLIVTVVNKGMAKKLVPAAKKAGAEGCTVIYGRGTGIHEMKKIWGLAIDPEKEVILTLIEEKNIDAVLSSIMETGRLNKPGTGIAFVVDMKHCAGIAHMLSAGS